MRGHYPPYKNKHANQTAKMLISSLSKTHTSAFTQHYSQAEMSHAKKQKQNKTKQNETKQNMQWLLQNLTQTRSCNLFTWGTFLARYLVYCFYDSHLQNNNNNKKILCVLCGWMNEWNEVVWQAFASRYQTLLQSLSSCIKTTFELLKHTKKPSRLDLISVISIFLKLRSKLI